MDKIKVILVCIHNSARSQMAEAFLKKHGGEKFEVTSAGLEPGNLNAVVVEVMKEIEIDISNNKTKSVFDFYKNGSFFNYVITVCDESQSETCPIFPGVVKQIHWSFADPSSFKDNFEENKAKTRKVRDEIETKIKQWLEEIKM